MTERGRPARVDWMLVALLATTVALGLLSGVLRGPCLALQSAELGPLTGSGCFSDLQVMWFDRGLADHLFPYLQPIIDPVTGQVTSVEYPALGGVVMWLLSLTSRTYAGFVWANTIVMMLAAAGITTILYRLAGRLAWLWAAAPALVFYLGYNFDALPALCAVGAVALALRSDPVRVAPSRYLGAAALLGVGGALKLFPLLLVPVLCLWLLFGRPGPTQAPFEARWRRALLAAAVALAVMVAVNLPFALANWDGWLAPYRFQAGREIGVSTLSVWFLLGSLFPGIGQPALMAAATVATALGLVLAYLAAHLVARRDGRFPVAGAAVAVLAAYLVLNKVFSPQYFLWLLPLLVLAGFRVAVLLFYVLLDPVIYIALNVADGALFRGDPAGGPLAVLLAAVTVRFCYVIVVGVAALRQPEPGRSLSSACPESAEGTKGP